MGHIESLQFLFSQGIKAKIILCLSLQVKTRISRLGGYGQSLISRARLIARCSSYYCEITLLPRFIGHWASLSSFSFRSQIPTHVSWSLDGSLLAVSLGSHVVIYDPVSTTVGQVLTWPECPLVSAAHFVGQNSRYLAVHGVRDVVVWDLVMQCCKLCRISFTRWRSLIKVVSAMASQDLLGD